MNTRHTGTCGERLVRDYLVGKGYAIVDCNLRVGNVEVDILAMHGNRIVVVEVKTRKAGHPDADFGIDRAKILRLARAGGNYVKLHNMPHEVQIDLVLVTVGIDDDFGSVEIEHLEDVALPPVRRHHR